MIDEIIGNYCSFFDPKRDRLDEEASALVIRDYSLALKVGGADRDRTCDPHNAIVVLYQLSYDPNQLAEM